MRNRTILAMVMLQITGLMFYMLAYLLCLFRMCQKKYTVKCSDFLVEQYICSPCMPSCCKHEQRMGNEILLILLIFMLQITEVVLR
jgi:hypothetical protein